MVKKNHTETKYNIQLVKRTFSPIGAADLLLSLLTYKIKFHTVQMLSNEVSYSPETLPSEQRIEELKNAKNMVKDLILKARNEGYEFQIESTITINLKKMKQSKEV